MTRSSLGRFATLLTVAFVALSARPATSEAQGYFGRNKVQYESFKWRILKSEHFDNFFYPAESLLVHDAARLAERWYNRHSETFRHAFDRKSLIFYADAPDFQQTNVITDQLEEGTGGVTEGMRTRVIMPFTGIYKNNDHVLGHELIHVFQYNIAEGAGGLQRLGALPLWLIEGMAEHFSVGRNDPLTAMWMRDAVMRDKFPTIEQLTTDPRFFPYRYGEALWAYVGGRWGDRAVVDVYRTSLRLGWDQALIRVLGMNSDSLSKEWAAANKATFLATAQSRTHPDSVGRVVVPLARSNDYNLSPSLSPDGKLVAFFSSRGLFGIDLYLADAQTGKIVKKLASSSSDRHFDAISFINSSGDWSPDGSKFAFVAYANGDNQIAILDARSTDVERRISLGEVGAVSSVAWSPDGNTLLIAGQEGGAGDLYLIDLKTDRMTRLTNDRYADYQPTFSPDGRSIAWSTDRATTDLQAMKWGELQLATMDLETKAIRTLATFPRGRSFNPQYGPDGRNVFFISDQDGIADLYRLDLASGQTFRLTKVATGISGITADSPAMSVARANGRMAFTVFKDQGFGIFSFEASQLTGTPEPGLTAGASLSELPPYAPNSLVQRYLNDPADGLASGADFEIVPYRSSFQLDAIGQPSLGASVGGPFGAGVVGGVSALWGDQLGDRQIFGAIQANGTVKDIGGAVQYYSLRDRWNWGVGAQHMPYLSGGSFGPLDTTVTTSAGPTSAQNIYLVLQRIYLDQASFFAQYPFSTTRRFEASLGGTHQSYSQEIIRYTFVNNSLFQQERSDAPTLEGITYAEPSVALVGDNSFSAYTSPVAGERYRLGYSPVIGDFTFQTVTADYRRYMFMRPFSLAFRGMHYGRYGKDAEDSRLWPLFLGEETFIRGYGYGSIRPEECVETTQSACPVFDRLLGSRIIVGNAEFRIPLFGSPEFGLINFPLIPIEVSPFFDAGVAYAANQAPNFRVATTGGEASADCTNPGATGSTSQFIVCTDRIPVFSTGLSFRANVLGYLIFEAYIAHPFQRPQRNWVWGFQLAPGW
ncbi:MAG TPA: DPP IV N-terminal domain-containing protein [Gemmatimonadaceae bacterium]|nr:DPP IV N-terminal domain-containing protein [Gemmatimonadaceae bacterium]